MVAGDAGSNGGSQVQYLEELEGWVLDERKVVTFRWLALVLSVTANAAKKMLYDFCQKQGERKVCPTYLVMGKSRADSGNGPMEVRVVSAEALEATKKSLEVVTAVHVYSVQPAPVSQPGDVSAQLWATDSEHSKEMLTGRTDAGANLRTHRLSGVRCPEVKDVAMPDAPKPPPPPDHAREVSPFARSGDVGKGAFPTDADKPKGKAIAPKDFFASAATGGGKGKGKTSANVKEEKGESKKLGPTGGIGSFFGKALPSKKGKKADENINAAVPVKIIKSEISTESEDKVSRKAFPNANDKKNGVKKEFQKDDKAGCSRVGSEAKTMANGSSAKKKPRLSKLATEDDELGSESDGGFGEGVEGAVKAGEDGSEEEEEWDDNNGKAARAGAGKKCASTKTNGSSTKKPTSSRKSTKSTERDEGDDGEKGGERSNSADGTACAPPAKKAKKGGASAKGGDGDESSTGRSRKGNKATATADDGGDEGGAANGGKRKSRGKGKGGEGVKRKGRYDSDDEGPEDEKVPVSGAMDKFTARGEGNGNMTTKRTKIVLKSRTYMEGGYMKSVNEEVEVTDDEEEILKPAHTNNTPSAPPEGDGKKVKSGAESRDAPGSKGGGRAKKAGGLKSRGGKQSSMMSFFKKAS